MKRVICSVSTDKVTGNTWKEFIQNLENRTGIVIESTYRRRYNNFIEGGKAGELYEIEVTKYFDGTYEAMFDNINVVE